MTWRFRKSFKLFPGVRLNLTARGISTTLGASPFSINVGPRGTFANVAIPGTGVWSRTRIGGPHASTSVHAPPTVQPQTPIQPNLPPPPVPPPEAEPQHGDTQFAPEAQQVRSAGTQALTSPGLEQFRQLIASAFSEQQQLNRELATARAECEAAVRLHKRWNSGFVFKHVRRSRFAQIAEAATTATARVEELEEQLRLTKIATDIDLPRPHAEAYARLCDDFLLLSKAGGIWDALAHQAVDRIRMRTMATQGTTCAPVTFRLGESDLIASKWQVPHLENRNGGDLFLYPGFVLYRVSDEAFALIDFHDVELETSAQNFVEQDTPPSDAEVVGQTWYKTNKDGTPDKRFKTNFQIPIVRYGVLKFRSQTGLNEEFMVSNHRLVEPFGQSWTAFHSLVTPQSST